MAGRGSERRILLVTNWIGWAGAEVQLIHLAIGLRRAGNSVVLLAIGGVFADLQPLREAGVEVVSLDAVTRRAKLAAVLKVARHARRADVVHCTGWDASLWGRLAAFLARRPVVLTEHTPGRELQVTDRNTSRARAIALHNRILDHVTYATIAVGAWQQELLESEGVRGESIVHIPNAVPVKALREKAQRGPDRAALGIPDGSLVIVQVARFASQKGQSMTLSAVDRLRGRLGDVRALFVGEGPEEESVKEKAARLGAEWATFLGFRDDVPGLVRLADLSVLPSTGEGLPMSLIESIVIGTPIVATEVGDVGWLLETTGAGRCVSPGDEDAFVEACAQVLGDADLRVRMIKAAAEAAADFDATKMVQRYEQVFEAAIESSPLPLVLAAV